MAGTVRHHPVVRRLDTGELLESFLVSAVVALLAVRFFLKLTGYPVLGTRGLHVAHMLWGGLFMMAAVVTLLVSTTRLPARVAAILGGIGFGIFLDELGKFLTMDNNYFYRPSIALIYAVFIVLYVVFGSLGRHSPPSQEAFLVTALDLTKEAVVHHFDSDDQRRALEALRQCDPGDPLVAALATMLTRVEAGPAGAPDPLSRARLAVSRLHHRLVATRWLPRAAIGVFVVVSLVSLVEGVVDVAPTLPGIGVVAWCEWLSSLGSGACIIMGVARLRRSRVDAYRMFERGVLISILLTQVFVFYQRQLVAIVGLLANVIILVTLRALIHEHEQKTG